MHILHKSLIAAAVACVMGSFAAVAAPGGIPGPNPNAPGQNKGAPGPLAGAGLPFLIVAGGYAWIKRRRNRARQVSSIEN